MRINIYKKFFGKMVIGEKLLEIRPLEKGIKSGKVWFYSVEEYIHCNSDHKHPKNYPYIDQLFGDKTPGYYEKVFEKQCQIEGCRARYTHNGKKDFYGTAHLTAIAFNPPFLLNGRGDIGFEVDGEDYNVDEETYDFVVKNYTTKGREYMVYEVTDVEVSSAGSKISKESNGVY